ncbi:Peptidoglycan O-acetyltransferase [Commensalibacter sp. Nvir]|uniref:MBOAT family O-acyltransferase n=1 Tax=Commensalibacter sp. Nvir TaxID=3069817 RepID=UPI002D65C2E8|nr:Peptidoglycan O-acetyltransferase [Commensalibacter sp. Nvir]
MLFSSQSFLLLFLPVVLCIFYSLASVRIWRQLTLITASLVFYSSWNWKFVPILIILTLFNWLIVCQYGRTYRKIWLTFGITFNIAVLLFFKYTNFFAANIEQLFGIPHTTWQILLPLGISFFIFQKISYLIDLKRGATQVYKLIDFAEFVTFFPQLIAGPIVRHNEIIPQFEINPKNPFLWENIGKGLCFILIGLFKKVGIADSLAMTSNPLFDKALQGHALSCMESWIAAIAYSLQIFFDFSGYSDMAIGLALLFGLSLPFNFNAPYQAKSLQEFWHRWHMTLSRFLRDYLYIPMGGNRCEFIRQNSHLLATMLIAGLWHGANWTFVAWGGLHGLGLCLNHIKKNYFSFKMPRSISWLLTLLFLIFSWVLFRSENFSTAYQIWQSMLGFHVQGTYEIKHNLIFFTAIVIALTSPSSQTLIHTYVKPSKYIALPLGLIAAYFILLIGGRIPDAFIYFRF